MATIRAADVTANFEPRRPGSGGGLLPPRLRSLMGLSWKLAAVTSLLVMMIVMAMLMMLMLVGQLKLAAVLY